MVGLSYPGISQLFVAQYQPPHLAAIAPLSVISDTVAARSTPAASSTTASPSAGPRDGQHDAMVGGQPWSQKRIDDGDQVCIDNMKLRGQTPDLLAKVDENNVYDPAIADPLTPATFVNKINVPVFLAGAWQDEQVGPYFATMLGNFTGTDKLHFTVVNGGHSDALDPPIFTRWLEFLSFYVRGEIPQLPAIRRGSILARLAQALFGVSNVDDRARPLHRRAVVRSGAGELRERAEGARPVRQRRASQPLGGPQQGFERSFNQWPVEGLQPAIWYFQDGGRLDPAPADGRWRGLVHLRPVALTAHQLPQLRRRCVAGQAAVGLAAAAGRQRRRLRDRPAHRDVGDGRLGQCRPVVEVDRQRYRPAGDAQRGAAGRQGDLRPDRLAARQSPQARRRGVDRSCGRCRRTMRPTSPISRRDSSSWRASRCSRSAHVFRAGSRIRISVEAPGGDRPEWKFDAALPADGAR